MSKIFLALIVSTLIVPAAELMAKPGGRDSGSSDLLVPDSFIMELKRENQAAVKTTVTAQVFENQGKR